MTNAACAEQYSYQFKWPAPDTEYRLNTKKAMLSVYMRGHRSVYNNHAPVQSWIKEIVHLTKKMFF